MPPAEFHPEYSSLVLTAQRGTDEERPGAIEHIIATHWNVLYKYLRLRYDIPSSDAERLMLRFLSLVKQKGFLDAFDGSKFPLRAFLKMRLDEYVHSPTQPTEEAPLLPIDFAMAEEELRTQQQDLSQSPEHYFESEWLRNIFTLAVEELYGTLQQEGKMVHFFLFLRYDLQGSSEAARPPLADLAKELSVGPQVAEQYLKETRAVYHKIVTDLIQSLTTSDAEFRREVQMLFGDKSVSHGS